MWIYAISYWKEEALEIINNSLKRHPGHSHSLDIKGFILYTMDENKAALEILSEAIGKNPEDKYPWYHKGNVQLKLGDYNDAERCYNRALEIDPNFAEAHNAKAIVFSYRKDHDNAARELRKAITINSSLAIVHENLAKLFISPGKRHQNFWDFWGASPYRKVIAIVLGIVALGIIIYHPLAMPPESTTSIEIITNESNDIMKNTTRSTTNTRSLEIPQTNLIVVGLIVLILLSPEIRTAKVGPLEIELQVIESSSINTQLILVDEEPIRMY